MTIKNLTSWSYATLIIAGICITLLLSVEISTPQFTFSLILVDRANEDLLIGLATAGIISACLHIVCRMAIWLMKRNEKTTG